MNVQFNIKIRVCLSCEIGPDQFSEGRLMWGLAHERDISDITQTAVTYLRYDICLL